MSRPIRVVVIDDSPVVRTLLRRGLEASGEFAVVGTAGDAYEGRDALVRERPDVVTLDIDMPRMDGITFLDKLMAHLPTRVVVLSSLTQRGSAMAMRALEAGAVDVVAKPTGASGRDTAAMLDDLRQSLRAAAAVRLVPRRSTTIDLGPVAEAPVTGAAPSSVVIGVGASTGGVAALLRILPQFPADAPAMVIVQHMPAGFTQDFAARLDELCAMRVREASQDARLVRGQILIAPGDQHTTVVRVGAELRVAMIPSSGELAPSVDRFFSSLALAAGSNAVGLILTGMGRDGADGLLAMRMAGAHTFAQDEASSAVFGMPGAAITANAAQRTVALDAVPRTLLSAARRAR